MLTYNLEQGSEEWLKLRLAIPTTSNFAKIITPGGKRSGSLPEYASELAGHLWAGQSQPFFKSDAMQRGNDLEPEAVSYYEHHTGYRTKEVGFITSNDGRIGCSPDRLVGKEGLLEVKCPLQNQHHKNLVSGEMDNKYKPQVQGQMLMTGRLWCDWMSYYPGVAASIVRVERDEEFMAVLRDGLEEVIEIIDAQAKILLGKGVRFKINLQPRVKEWS